jgi:hypothetical protein
MVIDNIPCKLWSGGEPAPGANCTHDATDPAHNCACVRECKQEDKAEGPPDIRIVEDPQCRVYCFKDHCHCPIHGCE